MILLMMMCGIAAMAQSVLPLPTFIGPPPVSLGSNSLTAGADSIMLPFPIRQAFPQTYEDMIADEFAADLDNPKNIRTVVEYDPSTGCYLLSTKLGDTTVYT
ncbi:MAG: hypothetical protein K2L63_05505, partial [Paramuribaculum sp.]|nr:hypothetical protein [Paramuribaculum sp.]